MFRWDTRFVRSHFRCSSGWARRLLTYPELPLWRLRAVSSLRKRSRLARIGRSPERRPLFLRHGVWFTLRQRCRLVLDVGLSAASLLRLRLCRGAGRPQARHKVLPPMPSLC